MIQLNFSEFAICEKADSLGIGASESCIFNCLRNADGALASSGIARFDRAFISLNMKE